MAFPPVLRIVAYICAVSAAAAPRWRFIERGNSGVIGLESIVVSPTLAVFFDRATNDPLRKPDGKVAWGSLYNMETNTARPLKLQTDSFCASASMISNGTMVSIGGHIPAPADVNQTGAYDGRMGLRLFEPCTDPAGTGCEIFEDPENLHLAETRWYPSSVRIFDGSLMVVGDPVNSFEFFPKKDAGVPRPSPFLERSLPVNLFPRAFSLPDGKVFILANNISMIYDVEKNTETMLPELPNGQRVSNPFDGTATMLPLSPPFYIPEILACGGSTKSDSTPAAELSVQDPATSQCARLTLSPAGIARGWQVEHMPQGRMMPNTVLLPNGEIIIVSGGATGYAAVNSVGKPFGNSNAANPIFTPILYNPSAPLGRRMTQQGLPTSNIARMYHATATLTPQGNIMLAGSNPNGNFTIVPPGAPGFSSELRVETLEPPYMRMARPTLSNVPKSIAFNQRFNIGINIPEGVSASSIKVALMDLGFSSHAFHSTERLVFMDAVLSPNRRTLSILSPPNNRVYPPGPGWIFVTIGDATSTAAHVMVGTGESPPVKDQGIRI
ncbi:hypothetical protein MKEN_00426700 [Mycena kentingensis (nom. inval.)]|nr:hypothetical protein MKEN_00426700 [Mycena kentingensis (nom. inval.)]